MDYILNLFQELNVQAILDTLMRVVAIFLCLTIHEAAHGVAAYWLGDPTAQQQHRLSLNPLHHIDWFGLLMMFTVGFGWAKPVPVDMSRFKNPKRGMAITALAGPASNFLLAFVLLLIGRGIYDYASYSAFWNVAFNFCVYVAAPLSVGLGMFNLLPIPPLDGSRLLTAFLPDRLYWQVMRFEQIGVYLLFAVSFLGLGGNFIGNAIYGTYDMMLNLFF